MSREWSNLLAVENVKRVFALLEQLRVGFVLVDPERRISHITLQARALLGRRRAGASAEGIFGTDRFEELWRAAGGADRRGGAARLGGWREWTVEASDGDTIDCAVCGMPVAFEDGARGMLIAVEDVSAEASLHRKYRLLLDEQREIAQHLQRQIAARLREHEDDIAQFAEILQIAPVVFSAFESEAATALQLCSEPLPPAAPERDEGIDARLRALHTLKGNARSLGLNFIGGRAHAAEGVLAALRQRYRPEQEQELSEVLVDLGRAVKRAGVIRKRLGETTHEQSGGLDLAQYEELAGVQELVERAERELAGALASDEVSQRVRDLLREARQRLEDEARVPLEPLFQYLKVVAVDAAKDVHGVCPDLTFSGGRLAVTPSAYRALQAALPHLVRNAVVHGIESDEERLALGKPAAGRISLSAQRDQAVVRLWLRDDGRGLALDRLRECSDGATPDGADAAALMFRSGVSTADGVTLTAGRGVGAASAKEAIEAVGGSIEVRSDEHVGLELAISLPQ